MAGADAVLVRSAGMHELEFDKDLKAIARAGAGVNNIPLDKCAEQGIVVFNTPGANANGVKRVGDRRYLRLHPEISLAVSTGYRRTKRMAILQKMQKKRKKHLQAVRSRERSLV